MSENTPTRKRAVNVIHELDIQYIERAHKYFVQEKENARNGQYPNFNQAHQRTADITGFSLDTIQHHFSKNGKNIGLVPVPAPYNDIRDRDMEIEMDPHLTQYWLRKIRDFLRVGYATLGEWPTVTWIYDEIKKIPGQTRNMEFRWSEETLRRLMTRHGFIINKRVGYYDNMRSKSDVRAKRDAYAIEIQKYREQKLDIYYMDETWGSQNMDKNEGWCWLGDVDENYNSIDEPAIKPPPMTSRNTGISFICE